MATDKELTFVVFMMHILSAAWNMSPAQVYAICRRCNALDNYLIPHYEVLHSMGTNALVEDLTEYVRERGCEV